VSSDTWMNSSITAWSSAFVHWPISFPHQFPLSEPFYEILTVDQPTSLVTRKSCHPAGGITEMGTTSHRTRPFHPQSGYAFVLRLNPAEGSRAPRWVGVCRSAEPT
jgi:hypothetical protein